MLETNRAINNFKINYSQARSRAALAKGETTWQCPSNPGGYLYRSPDGSVGPLAEFEDQFKGAIYKFYENDRMMNKYKKEMHDLIREGKKHGYMVCLSKEAEKNGLENTSRFTPKRVDKISLDLLETGLENGFFVIRDQEDCIVDIPKAPDFKIDAEYLHFDKQRQMARTAELLYGKNHRFAQNPVSKKINVKNHKCLRRDVDFIENGMNPDIVRFNEKYGTNINARLQNYERLKCSAIKENFTKEDEAFALFKAIEHFSTPSREELYAYFNEMRQSDIFDKKQKNRQPKELSVEIPQEEIQQKKRQGQERQDKRNNDASWDALIQKLCQFFIDYTRNPAETLNRFMAEYSDVLHKIRGDITNSYHNEFNELLNTSEKPIVRYISDELVNERSPREYVMLDKYLKEKDNHIETYRSFLSDENNSDIQFVDTDGEKVDVKTVAEMNKTEMEALVDLIDGGKISMSVDGKRLDSLKNDAYMNIHCDQDVMLGFEKQNMQLLKEELDMFRAMNDGQKKEYIEKNGFEPNAARDAYRYSVHKVHAMEHGGDMTDAAMEQLGLSFEKKDPALDKRMDAYLASQKRHYEYYNHVFDKAVASGEPVTVYHYKNKYMNPVKIGKLSELGPTDRMALADLIDHDRIFLYAGDRRIEPIYDKYTNPDNYRQGGEFYSSEISEAKFRAMAELHAVKDIKDKIHNLDNIPDNDILRKELESEKTYRKNMAEHLKGENAKSTDTYLVSARYLGLTNKINDVRSLSEYYKRDCAEIQKMVSDQIKMHSEKHVQNPEPESCHSRSKSDTVSAPERIVNEALQILNQGQVNRNDMQVDECSLCFH